MKSALPNVPVTSGGAGPLGVSTMTRQGIVNCSTSEVLRDSYHCLPHGRKHLDGPSSSGQSRTSCYGRVGLREYEGQYPGGDTPPRDPLPPDLELVDHGQYTLVEYV